MQTHLSFCQFPVLYTVNTDGSPLITEIEKKRVSATSPTCNMSAELPLIDLDGGKLAPSRAARGCTGVRLITPCNVIC